MVRQLVPTIQVAYKNPHAEGTLIIPTQLTCNTDTDNRARNIAINSARPLQWVGEKQAHDGTAIMCGGGPSLVSHLYELLCWQNEGAVIFAMNGASQFLRNYGIVVDYQVIGDSKPETASLVDPGASHHLFASQCDQSTFDATARTTLWHLATADDIEALIPEDRLKKGGYSLILGGSTVGNAALCIAYAMGFRKFEIYGYDSSHADGKSHSYAQPMNDCIPTTTVEWGGKTYLTAITMKAQSEQFQITGKLLLEAGCKVNVHGDGLLPAMWNTPPECLTERDKYRVMWSTESYRDVSPGEKCVPLIMDKLNPTSLVLDFGCGTGRASVELAKRGIPVMLIDFADNCRDEEAAILPFIEWDLTQKMPVTADYGICCDVMEHIPTEDVSSVIKNIMASVRKVFFQISTIDDHFGAVIGSTLHVTVRPHSWWKTMFDGYSVSYEDDCGISSIFIVERCIE